MSIVGGALPSAGSTLPSAGQPSTFSIHVCALPWGHHQGHQRGVLHPLTKWFHGCFLHLHTLQSEGFALQGANKDNLLFVPNVMKL